MWKTNCGEIFNSWSILKEEYGTWTSIESNKLTLAFQTTILLLVNVSMGYEMSLENYCTNELKTIKRDCQRGLKKRFDLHAQFHYNTHTFAMMSRNADTLKDKMNAKEDLGMPKMFCCFIQKATNGSTLVTTM